MLYPSELQPPQQVYHEGRYDYLATLLRKG